MNDVILYLTSPSTQERENMSLTNLRQLKKLGKDIIVLSTSKNISLEYYELANMVIIDSYNGTIYKDYYKKSDSYPQPYVKATATFYYGRTIPYYKVYANTHFLSLYRNTKNLIKLAYSLNYENFLFVEDDHYFSDTGLNKLLGYFDDVNINKRDALYFSNTWDNFYNRSSVIHSYFWFGNSSYFNESILHKFPENNEELDCNHPYTGDYESFLYNVMYKTTHNKNNIKFESVKEGGFKSIFGEDSKINQVYSYMNISDVARINMLYDNTSNYYKLILNYTEFDDLNDKTNLQVFIDGILYFGINLVLKGQINIIDLQLNLEKPINMKVLFDSKLIKEFEDLTKEEVIKNGVWG